jgi:hypothetical protein
MLRSKRIALRHAGVIAVLLALGGYRLQSPDLCRPFEVDELLTVRYDTWVSVQPSGEQRYLNHIEDYYALEPPEASQLGMGLLCSMTRWPEPNNHVLNSLLINASVALGRRDERWARVPAVLGAVIFAGALYFLCDSFLGWRTAAPLAALWAWFTPYVVHWSQTARGYSWMLALQVLLILLAYCATRTGRSVTLGVIVVALAVFSLMNVVSMAVDWLVPYFLALFFFRPTPQAATEAPTSRSDGAWRTYVLVQGLCVAGMGSIFFLDRFASLYSSAQQYGLRFHSTGEFFQLAYQIFDELFPGFWAKAFAVLGVIGVVALAAKRQFPFLAALIVLVLVVNVLHVALTRTFPYARAAGHWVPFTLIGMAYLAELIIRTYESNVSKVLMVGTFVVLTLPTIVSSEEKSLEDPGLSQCLKLAEKVKVPPDCHCYLPIRTGTDYILSMYCPRDWRRVDVVAPGMKLEVIFVDEEHPPVEALPGLGRERFYHLMCYSGETKSLGHGGDVPPNAWVFWYPEFTRLGLNAKAQHAYVTDSGLLALPQHARYQVKFAISSHLQCYLFIPGREAEARDIAEVVREGLRRFGGRAVVFVQSGPSHLVR